MTKEKKDIDTIISMVSIIGNVLLFILMMVIIFMAPKAKYGSVTPEDWHVAKLTCAGGKLLSVWLSENDEELSAHCQLGKGFYSATFDRQQSAKDY